MMVFAEIEKARLGAALFEVNLPARLRDDWGERDQKCDEDDAEEDQTESPVLLDDVVPVRCAHAENPPWQFNPGHSNPK